MPDLLVAGDSHIGRLQSIFPEKKWLDWTFAPLRQVEAYASQHGIRHIIQLGDVFDTANPEQRLLRALAKFLLESRHTWHFLIGNHDVHSRNRNSCVFMKYLAKRQHLGNCQFFPKAKRLTIAGVPTVFLPWPQHQSPLLNGPPSLVIGHVERHGARYDNGRRITGHNFKLGQHFWCIGHLHEFQSFDQLLFPGALSQLRFGDTPDKYFLHLRIKPTADAIQVKYKRIRLVPQFCLQDLIINKLTDLDALDKLPDSSFIRLLINADVAVPERFIRHPQVIKHRFFGDKRDLRAIRQDNFNLATAKETAHSRIGALKLWLRNNSQLSRDDRRTAVRYASRLETKLLQMAE